MTKKIIYLLSFLVLLFLIYAAAIKVFGGGNSHLVPQLLLLFAILFAATHTLPGTIWVGIFSGFLLELFSSLFFGSYLIALTLSGVLIYFLTRTLAAQQISVKGGAVLVVIALVVFNFLLLAVNNLAGALHIARTLPVGVFFSAKIFGALVVNLIALLPVYFVFNVLERSEKPF